MDIPWPVWQEKRPLSFLAQFDLAQLPAVDSLDLPRNGSLFFFYDCEAMPAGYDPEERNGAQVFYVNGPLAAHDARAWHDDLAPEFRYEGFALSAYPEVSLPEMDRAFMNEYQVTGEELSAYLNLAPLAYEDIAWAAMPFR